VLFARKAQKRYRVLFYYRKSGARTQRLSGVKMHRRIAVSVIACSLFGWSASAAERTAPIVGTWEVTSFTVLYLDNNETARPFGERPSGYIQYSPGGHMVVFLAAENRRQPAGTVHTDAERIELFKTIFGAYAGKYRVEDNKVIHNVVASWTQSWNGTEQVRYFELDGNKLTIKTAPARSYNSGRDIVSILIFERIE
jgi:hypothetical protein